jgi:hypothetical protein
MDSLEAFDIDPSSLYFDDMRIIGGILSRLPGASDLAAGKLTDKEIQRLQDTLKKSHKGKIAFFYTNDGKLWQQEGSDHTGMLVNMPELEETILKDARNAGENIKDTSSIKEEPPYRGYTKYAVVGRAGDYKGQNVIALWNNLNDSKVKPFLKKFLEKYPEYRKSAVITGIKSKPILLGQLANVTVSAPLQQDNYWINGNNYYRKEIADMLSAWHSQAWRREELKSVLCHPDMEKYDDLIKLIPPGCTPSQPKKSWYQATKQFFPVESALNFKAWLEYIP